MGFIKSFDDIIGHKHIVSYLKSKLSRNRVPNVILFNGQPGIGKTSIAKVLAIELNGSKDIFYEKVIDKNESVDCIKLYNMSTLGEPESVVSEMNTTFSSTGVKVLILDEVHGMTKAAQDAILVTLEYLPDNVYVFMCTTEVTSLRKSLLSRCTVLNLNTLSFVETKKLIANKVDSLGLKINMPREMFLSVVATWGANQPRKIINLLESFEPGSTVTEEELNVFVSTKNVLLVIELMKYLYGSMVHGINYINEISLNEDFLSSTFEVLKCAIGEDSSIINIHDRNYIYDFMKNNDVSLFIKFVVKINSYEYVRKRNVIAAFIENHVSMQKSDSFIPSVSSTSSKLEDIKNISEISQSIDVSDTLDEDKLDFIMKDLFSQGDIIE